MSFQLRASFVRFCFRLERLFQFLLVLAPTPHSALRRGVPLFLSYLLSHHAR